MKSIKYVVISALVLAIFALVGCEPERVVIEAGPAGYDGYHVGYSWAGETNGTTLADASAYIETILKLDENASILEVRMRYFQRVDGYWTTRQAGNARVTVDFSATPTPATLGSDYRPGTSMFSIYTVNPMSLYAVAVNSDSTVAVALVESQTRYQFEMKFPPGFDYRTQMSELTVGSGLLVPTVRTSGGAWLVPEAWGDLANRHLFNLG